MKTSVSNLPSGVGRIGLIADTHGSLGALERSIDVLNRKGADILVHLGDFCDTVRIENLSGIVSLMETERVKAVKGNNDYQVEKMIDNGHFPGLLASSHAKVTSFLNHVPMVREMGGIAFSHSMPFDTIRAFYDPVDDGTTTRAVEIFEKTDYHILFCGHSHSPVFFRQGAGTTTRETVKTVEPIGILPDHRYIFIIGSAEKGECGLYDIGRSSYEYIII